VIFREVFGVAMMDTEEGHRGGKEEEEGGQGLRPLYRHGLGAVLYGGRSPTVSRPPLQAAVGRQPSSALAVGAC
jgi:hypothetical protein